MIMNTILRSIAWSLTRRITNDLYDKATKKKQPIPRQRKRNARSKNY